MYQLEHDQDDLIIVTVRGTLGDHDYERLVPELEAEIAEHGRVRMVWEMIDFEGWTAGGMWRDARFDLNHNRDVTHLAMIGDKRWQDWLTRLMKPLARGKVRYFPSSERDAAYAWVRSDA